DAVLVFLQRCGGSAKNTELLAHFLPYLRDNPENVGNRDRFKSFVNSVATVSKIDGVSTVTLRKKYRGTALLNPSEDMLVTVRTTSQHLLGDSRSFIKVHSQPPTEEESRTSQGTMDSLSGPSKSRTSEGTTDSLSGPSKSRASQGTMDSSSGDTPESRRQQVPQSPELRRKQSSTPNATMTSVLFGPLNQSGPIRTRGCRPICTRKRKHKMEKLGNRPGPGRRRCRTGGRQTGTASPDLVLAQSSPPPVSVVPLEAQEHDWMVKAAAGAWPDIYALFRTDSSLLNRKDFISGFTVLHWIAKHGDHRVINTLWYGMEQKGLSFDVNAKSTAGQTPLHIAAIHGHKNIIRLLVKKFSADVKLRDTAGKKAWQYLSDRAPDILELLAA
uniref:SOWAHA-C winged helix-turn-helix domain-containing protein n=1 Tax=Poecilia formosa TaxID=48698 RepID=A0A087YM34_POEFO